MSGLSGSFDTMPIRDLLEYLAGRSLDGTLYCESGSYQKTLHLDGGRARGASSNDPREYLGQFLINFGHITEEDLARAFETQKETNIFLGRILVMIGLVEEETIQALLTLKLRETVISLMDWEHGQFVFTQGEVQDGEPEIEVAIPLSELISEADQRKAVWSAIASLFPSDDLYLRIDPNEIPVKFEHPLDERIIELAAQGQTIAEVELSLHATPYTVRQRLLALHEVGIISPLSPDEIGSESDILATQAEEETALDFDVEIDEAERAIPQTLGEEASVAQIVSMAREFLTKGRYREAATIASRAVELAPRDSQAAAAMREAETGLLAELREKLLQKSVVPRVVAGPEKLRARKFSPAERYLLKRLDGKRPLMSVLQVSPIKEVEALRIVDAMLAAGILSLDPAA